MNVTIDEKLCQRQENGEFEAQTQYKIQYLRKQKSQLSDHCRKLAFIVVGDEGFEPPTLSV